MSAVGILLFVSRGAILCFGLSLAVSLIAAGKGQRLARLLGRHVKIAAIAMGGVVAALTLTEPYTFPEGRGIQHGAALPSGEYTLTAEGDLGEACRVYIRKTSDEEAMLGKTTTLYSGSMENVSFTVPEDIN